jgi:aminocarboxymuconate-semialdehyde decarboxylase
MIDGKIDFHTHYIPRTAEHFDAHVCPTLVCDSDTVGNLYRGGKHYRLIDDRSWSAARRIVDMDARDVAMQVISPIPVTYAYDAPAAEGLAFARLHNDGIAEVVRARPDRFAGLGAVPLQDVDAACTELERAVRELGLAGVEIGSTTGAHDFDDPIFEPFWERCDALGAIVFMHPESAPGMERLRQHQMVISTGYPTETGITAAKLLMAGISSKFPRLRLVLAHGGGTLPWLLPRLDRIWNVNAKVREAVPARPSEMARALYCDTLTFDAENLAVVARRIGAGHLMIGSDYPFAVMEDPPGAVLDGDGEFDEATKRALRRENALRLLGTR